MRISSIIVTYNSDRTIQQSFNSLNESLTTKDEIIIIDNNSKDKTISIIKNLSGHYKLIINKKNLGFAQGVNLGLSVSKGKYILLANPDLILNRDCVEGLIKFLKLNQNAAAVGPKLIYPNGVKQPSCRRYPKARAIFASQLPFKFKSIFKKSLDYYYMSDLSLAEPVIVEWIIGACMMIKRDAIETIGLFDKNFFLYREDTDWCYRANQHGWKIFYFPQCEAIHHYNRKSTKGFNRELIMHLKSMFKFYRKYGFRF
jgi:GT2 family glycosyltransferase